jgi:hypothetical protein
MNIYLRTDAVRERVMPQTIGVAVSQRWDNKVHVGRMQIVSDEGMIFCNEVLHVFAKAGDKMKVNDKVNHAFYPVTRDTKALRFRLYGSSSKDVMFCSDSGVKLLGFLGLDIPDTGTPRHGLSLVFFHFLLSFLFFSFLFFSFSSLLFSFHHCEQGHNI